MYLIDRVPYSANVSQQLLMEQKNDKIGILNVWGKNEYQFIHTRVRVYY